MNWFFSIIRMAGSTSPLTSWLVQLQAELDAGRLEERLSKLEDPISILHQDVPELSRALYEKLKHAEVNNIALDDSAYSRFRRALAALESAGFIRGNHAIGNMFAACLTVSDPSYILYLCARFEDNAKMEKLTRIVDSCGRGQSLRAQDVMKETGLANPIVVAVFKVFEAKGYGMCSRETGLNQMYVGKA